MVSKPYNTDFNLSGKVAAITGAGSGIGLATASLFSEKGASVCLLDRNFESVQIAAGQIRNARPYAVDVSKVDSIYDVTDKIAEDNGKIDVLVNCAGVGDIKWAEDFDEATWNKVIRINLTGTFFMSQAVGKKMISAKNGGKIICMASQAGIVAIDKHAAYSASKAGIISIVKTLANEWGKYGIQINAVSPTATETPIIVGYWDTGKIHVPL